MIKQRKHTAEDLSRDLVMIWRVHNKPLTACEVQQQIVISWHEHRSKGRPVPSPTEPKLTVERRSTAHRATSRP